MQQKENFLFKTVVEEMYKYFFTDIEISIDEKISKLKILSVPIEDTSKSDKDYETIMKAVVERVNEYNMSNKNKIEIKDIRWILNDFRLDISPTYVLI